MGWWDEPEHVSSDASCSWGLGARALHCFVEHPSLLKWSKGHTGQWRVCCQCCWLEKHLLLNIYCCFKYFICILLPLEIPSAHCKLTYATYVSWRSQLLAVNDERRCWCTVGEQQAYCFSLQCYLLCSILGSVAQLKRCEHIGRTFPAAFPGRSYRSSIFADQFSFSRVWKNFMNKNIGRQMPSV